MLVIRLPRYSLYFWDHMKLEFVKMNLPVIRVIDQLEELLVFILI